MFGILSVVRTDNGPPFNSRDFSEFACFMGFRHRKITPECPRANAKCERFMRNLNKVVRGAQVSGMPWKQELNKFLRSYRSTPHSSTKIAPSLFWLNRNTANRLQSAAPEAADPLSLVKTAILNDKSAAEKTKSEDDRYLRTKPKDFRFGDQVLIKQKKRNKTTPTYNPLPLSIIAKNGTMITASSPDKIVTRNVSHFKTPDQTGKGKRSRSSQRISAHAPKR